MRSKIQEPVNILAFMLSKQSSYIAQRCYEVSAQVSDGFSLGCLETCSFAFTRQDLCQPVVNKLNDKLDTLEDIRVTYNQC